MVRKSFQRDWQVAGQVLDDQGDRIHCLPRTLEKGLVRQRGDGSVGKALVLAEVVGQVGDESRHAIMVASTLRMREVHH